MDRFFGAKRRVGFLVVFAIAVAGLVLAGLGVIDQWVRYRDFLADGLAMTDRACALPYCDYPLFREAGLLARAGKAALAYQPDAFLAATDQEMAPHGNLLPFMYPPVALLLIAPFSALKFLAGYYGFTAFSLLGGVLLLWRAGVGWVCIAIGLLGVPAMWCLYLGQFGLICGAVLVFGLLRIESRPWVSGALLACLVIKPQYALLVPVVVLARRDWRAGAAGISVLAGLAWLSVLVFGVHAWEGFWGPGRAAMRRLLEAPFGPGYEMQGASVFWLARSLSGGIIAAYGAQAAAAGAAAWGCWWLWRRPDMEPVVRAAMTVCLVMLADPHSYTDDLVAYSVVLPMLARRGAPVETAMLAVLWLAPAFAADFARMAGFLPMPFCIAALLLLAWRRLEVSSAPPVYLRVPRMALRP